jgi:ribosomal protein S18 acetylase RimI-like enzyme
MNPERCLANAVARQTTRNASSLLLNRAPGCSKEMRIRLAQIEDYNQLLSLLRQLNPADPEATAVEYRVFEEIIKSRHLDLIVAEDEGYLLGSCYVNFIPNMTRGGRPYAVIENVITDSAHRGRGIGKALIRQALDLSWKENCYKVMLMSGRQDEAVHAFYKKCGFDSAEKQAYIYRAP